VSADYYVSWSKGDDSNPGTLNKPFKTPGRAVQELHLLKDPSGTVVLIRGGTYRLRDHSENKLKLKDLSGSKNAPIEIRGYPGEEVILDAFTADFNPVTAKQVPVGWGGISINKSNHLLIENFKIMGREMSNIELLDSNYVTIRFCEASRSNKHGLFTGGSFHHLTIEACKFYEHIYGSTASHGIYISGGHWDPSLPPVRDVTIRYVECYFNGRHGIQFNGRGENITIEHCNLHHNILGGVSLIGAREVNVSNNLIYKNNKQGVILYTYFDTAYWDPNDPVSVAHWKSTHWTIQDVIIKNNTIFMDDDPWYDDEWINYKPSYHAGIYLVDTTGLLPPFDDIRVENNIIYNHSKSVINFDNPDHFPGTSARKNIFFSSGEVESIGDNGYIPIEVIQKKHPMKWQNNINGLDPLFMNLTPTQLIDRSYILLDFADPKYTNFEDDFRVKQGSPSFKVNAGAFQKALPIVETLISVDEQKKIPIGYGEKIFQKITNSNVMIAVQNWFFSIFNPQYICLNDSYIKDGRERICFRHPIYNIIAFAIYNDKAAPIEVCTRLQYEAKGGIECMDCISVTFDRINSISIMKNLDVKYGVIDQALNANSLGIYILLYK